MSEINGPKFSVNQVNFNGVQRNVNEEPTEVTEEKAQITDFSNSKAEALGRSMLLKESDSVNNDLKALLDNPQIADNSDEIFETAYAAAQANGIENPYEASATVSRA